MFRAAGGENIARSPPKSPTEVMSRSTTVNRRFASRDRRRRIPATRSYLDRRGARSGPSPSELGFQITTRLLLGVLGLQVFGSGPTAHFRWIPPLAMQFALGGYLVLSLALGLRALYLQRSDWPRSAVLRIDLAIVSICVLNDPFAVPPTAIAFVMAFLANGLRSGPTLLWDEAVIETVAAATLVLGLRHLDANGVLSASALWVSLGGSALLLAGFRMLQAINAMRRTSEQIDQTDDVTGLANRRGLAARAERLLAEAEGGQWPVSVVVIAMRSEGMAHVDSDTGALQAAADALRHALRQGDIAGRYDSGEFVVLLPHVDEPLGRTIARRIREQLGDEFALRGVPATPAVALAEAPAHGTTLGALLEHAERSLARAVDFGGPRVAAASLPARAGL